MRPKKKFVKTYKLQDLFTENKDFYLFCNSLKDLLLIFDKEFSQRKIDYFLKLE